MISQIEKLERTITAYIKKWLSLTCCLTNVGLYGKGALRLPISSLIEGYMCAKARLEMILKQSQDSVILAAAPKLVTGKKWMPFDAVEDAKPTLSIETLLAMCNKAKQGLGCKKDKVSKR